MEPRSEQLKREAEEVRCHLSGTLEELRDRMTPGRVVDQMIEYTRDGPVAEFLRNLGRESRANPMPLVLIGIGIAWLIVASNRTARAVVTNAANAVASKATEIGAATSAVVSKTSEWTDQTAARMVDRASEVATTVGNKTATLASHVRDLSDGLTERARATTVVGNAVEKAKWPLVGTPESTHRSEFSTEEEPELTVGHQEKIHRLTRAEEATARGRE